MQHANAHALRCRCGALKGRVRPAWPVNRVVCYCRDCQAFARFLGNADGILDAQGGTDIVQTRPSCVSIDAGADKLACVRLSDKGLLRWYASCCRTPIGNTLVNHRLSFVGLIHNCLEHDARSVSDSFGPVTARSFTDRASGGEKPKGFGLPSTLFKVVVLLLGNRISGAYRKTPFFDAASGRPVAAPQVLAPEQRRSLDA